MDTTAPYLKPFRTGNISDKQYK